MKTSPAQSDPTFTASAQPPAQGQQGHPGPGAPAVTLLQQPEFTDREGTAECCSSHRNSPYQPSIGTLIIPIFFPSCQLTNCLHDDLYSSPYPEGEICSLLMHIHPSLQDFSAQTQPSWHMTRCDFCAVTSACPLPSPIRVRSTLVPLTPTTAT